MHDQFIRYEAIKDDVIPSLEKGLRSMPIDKAVYMSHTASVSNSVINDVGGVDKKIKIIKIFLILMAVVAVILAIISYGYFDNYIEFFKKGNVLTGAVIYTK